MDFTSSTSCRTFPLHSALLYNFHLSLTVMQFSSLASKILRRYGNCNALDCFDSSLFQQLQKWGCVRRDTQRGYSNGQPLGCPGTLWRTRRTLNARYFDMRYSIQTTLLAWPSLSPQHHQLTTISVSHLPAIPARSFRSFQGRVQWRLTLEFFALPMIFSSFFIMQKISLLTAMLYDHSHVSSFVKFFSNNIQFV